MTDGRIEEIRGLLPRAMVSDWVRLGSRLVRLLRDHNHPAAHEAVLNRLLEQARASVALRERRGRHAPAVTYPEGLPISVRKDEIVAGIRQHQVLVIAGETGSGKTTQIPKMCLEAGLGVEAKVGCTQPRRVAALSISRRIAEELNVDWGREVGCKIRFDDRSSPETYIKLMTDGILLAETQGDPLLSEYNALIIDEAHERSLNIDFLLGYLKGLTAKRPELKLIITSATIDTEAFSRAFGNAPIIEVSGRVYPVEVVYAPFDHASEESGEVTYIDAAAQAAVQVVGSSGSGDVLIFMPGERDIRETSDLLKARCGDRTEIIPLFGRLSAGDQQRVFAPTSRRKIVVSTNIAETSLTIPGIRFVIDSGLARISRYNSRTRTKRLPVESISQSSANQRKGRSGRVQEGVCIRLYSEEDFLGRPLYTQPEIQRANLAEVILRMKVFGLGEIETFPFINPPSPAAIQGGYALLEELGALTKERKVTPLGEDLARLPIDPTLGRMLLQAQHEHATHELLIIAAGLSIQDPRERPLDQKDAAAAAHKRFADLRSDFLTLLNIWNAVHDQWENLATQNQRRKFCKANFLSYLRMREWQDLHAQLHEALEELTGEGSRPGWVLRRKAPSTPRREVTTRRWRNLQLGESNVAYDAVHRSILAGLLGHVATRTERNVYKAAAGRSVTVFPGSALYDRAQKNPKVGSSKAKTPTESEPTRRAGQPEWMVAGEIVETSQLFARTVAGIDPEWIVELAPHLCRVTHQNPHWSASAGRVLAEEKISLYGLEVHQRLVAYGNINPKEATEIFVRSALVEEDLFPDEAAEINARSAREPSRTAARLQAVRAAESSSSGKLVFPARFRFVEHNRKVRQKVETWQTRARRHDLGDLDERLAGFYGRHIENVSSVEELNRLVGSQRDSNFLCATEADLVGDQELSYDAQAFPDEVALGGQSVALAYAYSPGEDEDGVTLKMGLELARQVSQASVEWAVPGLREGQIRELLRALPKTARRELQPLAPKVAEIVRELRPGSASLKDALAQFIHRRYGVRVDTASWAADAVPQHLQPRVEVTGPGQKSMGASRDLNLLRIQLEKAKAEPPPDSKAWANAARQRERFDVSDWTFAGLPERVTISTAGTKPEFGWLGLQVEEGGVNLRLFRDETSARRASVGGAGRLVELALQKDLAWLHKDLRSLQRLIALWPEVGTGEDLQAAGFEHLKRFLIAGKPWGDLAEASFRRAVERARSLLPGLAHQFYDRLELILNLRQEFLRRFAAKPMPRSALSKSFSDLGLKLAAPTAGGDAEMLRGELDRLLPKDFLVRRGFASLEHLPRYLKALITRAERAALNPVKDQERAKQVAPYVAALTGLEAALAKSEEGRQSIEQFRWMLEEFKVSVFAQDLGTAFPVSAKRLDEQLQKIANQS
jgi:ATP-dependent helicase HrpA